MRYTWGTSIDVVHRHRFNNRNFESALKVLALSVCIGPWTNVLTKMHAPDQGMRGVCIIMKTCSKHLGTLRGEVHRIHALSKGSTDLRQMKQRLALASLLFQ